MIKEALIEVALFVCHQGLKGLPDLQSARETLLWGHKFEGVVLGISSAPILAYQSQGVNTHQSGSSGTFPTSPTGGASG